jgi:RND family efflux transporter MFP subunit
MSKTKKIIFTTIALLLIAFFLIPYEEEQVEETKTEKTEAIYVKTKTIKPVSKNDSKTYYGELKFANSSHFVAQQPGIITQINAKAGQKVKKGQTIVVYPPTNHKIQIDQARIEQEKLANDLKRQEELFKAGAASKVSVSNLKTQLSLSQKNMSRLNQVNIIKAPFTGIVTEIQTEKGNEVQPGNILFSMAKSSEVEVEFYVSGKEINSLSIGDKAKLKVNNQSVEGKISKKSIQIDPKKRAFKITASFATNTIQFAGGHVQIEILKENQSPQIWIPSKALRNSGSTHFVFLNQKGKSKRQKVRIGKQTINQVQIKSGLQEGDRLIIEGTEKLEENMALRIVL